MKYLIKFFRYIEPLWLGRNKKLSIRSVLALAFSINFMVNSNRGADKLIIDAGLITALLALRTYTFTQSDKLDKNQSE